jgi:hypothetical protein
MDFVGSGVVVCCERVGAAAGDMRGDVGGAST